MIKPFLLGVAQALKEVLTILYCSTIVGVGLGLGLLAALGIAIRLSN